MQLAPETVSKPHGPRSLARPRPLARRLHRFQRTHIIVLLTSLFYSRHCSTHINVLLTSLLCGSCFQASRDAARLSETTTSIWSYVGDMDQRHPGLFRNQLYCRCAIATTATVTTTISAAFHAGNCCQLAYKLAYKLAYSCAVHRCREPAGGAAVSQLQGMGVLLPQAGFDYVTVRCPHSRPMPCRPLVRSGLAFVAATAGLAKLLSAMVHRPSRWLPAGHEG